MNREEWLTLATDKLRPALAQAGAELGEVRVSCGWPSKRGTSTRKRVVGECWHQVNADHIPQCYVSPVQADPVDVLSTLLHELTHAAVKVPGHKGPFVKVCKALGFTKPWTATPMGPDLQTRLNALSAELGPYPHVVISVQGRTVQGTRLRLWECECPVKVRVASDEFHATCDVCEEHFVRQGGDDA